MPSQTADGPLIVPALGVLITVIVLNVSAVPQPVVTVYVIFAVPAETPRTLPVEGFTDAIVGALLPQAPPLTELESEILAPTHTEEGPVITPTVGRGFTVMVLNAWAVPQPLVTE